jgi:hypothetical protein
VRRGRVKLAIDMIPPDNAPCRHDAGLVNAPLVSAVCDHGMGRQMPPGLLIVGGTLRGRAAVTLIDAARDHLTDADIVREWTPGGPKSSPG